MEKKVKGFYDDHAEKYHDFIEKEAFYNIYLEVPATLSMLGNVKGKQVLDLGCGTGKNTSLIKDMGADVSGIDISDKMVEVAKREFRDIDFRVGTALKLPHGNAEFDAVVAFLVMGHIKDWKKAFAEVFRVLKPGGIFVFSMNNLLWDVAERYKEDEWSIRVFKRSYFEEGEMKAEWRGFGEGPWFYHRTLESVINTILKAGFIFDGFKEARPLKEGKKLNPDAYELTSTIPYFYVFRARKP
jgi:ubiquinone/menaquinone biosynthesis C-methylase UbiE